MKPTSVFPSGAVELTKVGAMFESGVTTFVAVDALEVPTPFVAVTVNVY